MELYIYCQTGHNFGLENLRRCATIYKKLEQFDPILATSDYRAVSYAKEFLGVKKAVGVDVIENLPNMMLRNDILIFDSKEPTDVMRKHMKDFCSELFEVGVDIPYDIVDDNYFEKIDTKYEKCIFFADDDYENEMLEFCKNSTKNNLNFLLGHYFFLSNDDKLSPYFKQIIDDEEYIDTIKSTKYLLTSSINSCLESIASGNFPVYFQRKIKENKGNLELLQQYGIPTIKGENLDKLVLEFEKIILNYPKIKKINKIDISIVNKKIEDTFDKYKAVLQ